MEHRGLGKVVASGHTDQVGKSVITRKGTLFVGEEYVVKTIDPSALAC